MQNLSVMNEEFVNMMQLPGLIFIIIALFICFYFFRERQYAARFAKYMEMDVRAGFYEGLPAIDSYRRGAVIFELRHLQGTMKSVVITQLRFSDSALQVNTLDNIYFKPKMGKSQVLSVGFRTRTRDFSVMKNKNI